MILIFFSIPKRFNNFLVKSSCVFKSETQIQAKDQLLPLGSPIEGYEYQDFTREVAEDKKDLVEIDIGEDQKLI